MPVFLRLVQSVIAARLESEAFESFDSCKLVYCQQVFTVFS